MRATGESSGARRLPPEMSLKTGLILTILTLILSTQTALSVKSDGDSMEQFDPAFSRASYGSPRVNWRINLGPDSMWDGSSPFMPISSPNRDSTINRRGEEKESIQLKLEDGSSDPIESMVESTIDADMYQSSFFNSGLGFLDSLLRKSRPWWKGPNVCVSREESDDSDSPKNTEGLSIGGFILNNTVNIQTCHSTNSKYECVQKIRTPLISITKTVRYQCCSGFLRRGNKDCEKVDLLSLLETIKKLNGSEFLSMSSEIEDRLSKENFTIFLPSNEAFKKFADNMLETNQVELMFDPVRRRRRSSKGISTLDLIMTHMTKGFKEVCPDEIYESLYNSSTLRVKYVTTSRDEPQFLVNCGRVTSSNIYATNGIIHTIDRVLMSVTRTIMEIVNHRKNFSTLKMVLEKTGFANSLDSNEIWTLFAPTNEAFEKFAAKNSGLMEKLLQGGPCAKNILKNHLLTYSFCSSAVELGALGVRNSLGEFLNLAQFHNKTINLDNGQMRFTVNKKLVSEVDIIATNGVIHVIDDILLPDSALPIMKVLEMNNLTLFSDLIKMSDMIDVVDSLSNFTFIIPTDKAIKKYIDEKGEYTNLIDFFSGKELDVDQKEELRNFIFHHIVPGAIESTDLVNNYMIENSDEDDDDDLRVNLYNTMPVFSNVYNRATIDCAKLLHFDLQQCDNIIHQIDRPLIPHNGTLLDLIKDDPKFSMLYKIIAGTLIENILDNEDNITFIAPVNEVFENLSAQDYDILVKKKSLSEALMKLHIIDDVVCSAGVYGYPWPFVNKRKALNGQNLLLSTNRIGNAVLISTDHMANNGVLHYTNKFMVPSKSTEGEYISPNVDIQLFGINI